MAAASKPTAKRATSLENVFRFIGDPQTVGNVDPARDVEIPVLARPTTSNLDFSDSSLNEIEVQILGIGGLELGLANIGVEEISDLLPDQKSIVRKAFAANSEYGKFIVELLKADNGAMAPLKQAIDSSDRFKVDAWFERDRAHLALNDELTGTEVVDLWDDAVNQAIEDGFLVAPKHPRPSESMWLQPLIDYAKGTGAMEAFDIEPTTAIRRTTHATP